MSPGLSTSQSRHHNFKQGEPKWPHDEFERLRRMRTTRSARRSLDFGSRISDPIACPRPEPFQFLINDHTLLMLIPRDGFEYTLGGALIAKPTTHSNLLSINAGTPAI